MNYRTSYIDDTRNKQKFKLNIQFYKDMRFHTISGLFGDIIGLTATFDQANLFGIYIFQEKSKIMPTLVFLITDAGILFYKLNTHSAH